MRLTKQVDLTKLVQELKNNGIDTGAGLVILGNVRDNNANLFVAKDEQEPEELPSSAIPIIDAHIFIDEVEESKTDLKTTVQQVNARLDDIINNGPTYTAAQVRTAVIDEARMLKRLVRYLNATS